MKSWLVLHDLIDEVAVEVIKGNKPLVKSGGELGFSQRLGGWWDDLALLPWTLH